MILNGFGAAQLQDVTKNMQVVTGDGSLPRALYILSITWNSEATIQCFGEVFELMM